MHSCGSLRTKTVQGDYAEKAYTFACLCPFEKIILDVFDVPHIVMCDPWMQTSCEPHVLTTIHCNLAWTSIRPLKT